MERLKCISVVRREAVVPEETLRVVLERLFEVDFVMVHGPLVDGNDSLRAHTR